MISNGKAAELILEIYPCAGFEPAQGFFIEEILTP
jgi:hypothetical protein